MKILLTEKRPNCWYNASVEGMPHLQVSGVTKHDAIEKLLVMLNKIEVLDLCGGSVPEIAHNPNHERVNTYATSRSRS